MDYEFHLFDLGYDHPGLWQIHLCAVGEYCQRSLLGFGRAGVLMHVCILYFVIEWEV